MRSAPFHSKCNESSLKYTHTPSFGVLLKNWSSQMWLGYCWKGGGLAICCQLWFAMLFVCILSSGKWMLHSGTAHILLLSMTIRVNTIPGFVEPCCVAVPKSLWLLWLCLKVHSGPGTAGSAENKEGRRIGNQRSIYFHICFLDVLIYILADDQNSFFPIPFPIMLGNQAIS